MSLKEIAEELVAGCRESRAVENLDKLYAEDAASVEAVDYSGMGREVIGRDAIRGKHEWWAGAHEVTGGSVSDPMLHGDERFAVIFSVSGTVKDSGEAFDMQEIGLYHVENGRIVKEEFFY